MGNYLKLQQLIIIYHGKISNSTKKVIIKDIVDRLEDIENETNGRVPYGWIKDKITKANKECPTLNLTKHHINNEKKG